MFIFENFLFLPLRIFFVDIIRLLVISFVGLNIGIIITGHDKLFDSILSERNIVCVCMCDCVCEREREKKRERERVCVCM